MSKIILVAAFVLTACSGKVMKPDALAEVKRVAIVGLDLQQQKTVSAGDLASIALKTATKSEATPALRVESPHVEPVYKDLAKDLNEKTGWKVLGAGEVRKSAAYQELFKEKTEGFQNRPMLNDRFVLFAPPGILDSFAVITSPKDKLIALATALKVDAIVYATSTVNLNNNSIFASLVGAGEFKPSSNLALVVLDGRTGEKIYSESVNGPKVDTAAKNTLGMADDAKVNALAQMATRLSTALAIQDLSTVKR